MTQQQNSTETTPPTSHAATTTEPTTEADADTTPTPAYSPRVSAFVEVVETTDITDFDPTTDALLHRRSEDYQTIYYTAAEELRTVRRRPYGQTEWMGGTSQAVPNATDTLQNVPLTRIDKTLFTTLQTDVFDSLERVGDARCWAFARAFPDIHALKAASRADLKAVPGIGTTIASDALTALNEFDA